MTTVPIRTLCSWCPAVIVDVPAPADGMVSHGICPECSAAIFPPVRPVLVMLDSDGGRA